MCWLTCKKVILSDQVVRFALFSFHRWDRLHHLFDYIAGFLRSLRKKVRIRDDSPLFLVKLQHSVATSLQLLLDGRHVDRKLLIAADDAERFVLFGYEGCCGNTRDPVRNCARCCGEQFSS